MCFKNIEIKCASFIKIFRETACLPSNVRFVWSAGNTSKRRFNDHLPENSNSNWPRKCFIAFNSRHHIIYNASQVDIKPVILLLLLPYSSLAAAPWSLNFAHFEFSAACLWQILLPTLTRLCVLVTTTIHYIKKDHPSLFALSPSSRMKKISNGCLTI